MPINNSDILNTGERWLLNAAATKDQLSNLEHELEIDIPSEMRELLICSNGVKLPHPMFDDPIEAADNGFEILFGVERLMIETKHFRHHWILDSGGNKPHYAEQIKNFLIIAEDGSGNYIAYSSVGREDGRWELGLLDHETREYEAWENYGVLDLLTELYSLQS